METAKIVKIDESGNTRKLWVKCPHCACIHGHGGGEVETARLADYLGHRVADCGRGGYVLDLISGQTVLIPRK
jgi:hypothetical protein